MESLAIALIGLALVLMIQAHSMATSNSIRELNRAVYRMVRTMEADQVQALRHNDRIAKAMEESNAMLKAMARADVYEVRREEGE